MKIYLPIIIISLILSACQPRAVVKEDVSSTSTAEREKLVELRKNEIIDSTDIARVGEEKAQKNDKQRYIREIKGGEEGVKFYDTDWEDFYINLSLNVVPLRVFFQMMHRLTGLNFIVGDEIKGDLTIELKDVGWIEALDLVIRNKNLISEVNKRGNVVTIHTHEFATTQSTSLQKALAAKTDVIKAYSGIEPKITSIVRLYYTKPDVIATQLKEIIASIDVGGSEDSGGAANNSRASFVVDARSNSIIVQATPTDMEWIKSAISNLDNPTKQVLVEVFIVEGTDDFQQQLGSRVGLFNNFSNNALNKATIGGTTAGTPPTAVGDIDLSTGADGSIANNPITGALGGIGLVTGGDTTNLRFELQAMQQESLIKIVSNPKLFILDNEEATITDGQEVPYFTQAMQGATPMAQFKNASLQLQVKPSVIEDGNIYLDLTINKDTPLTGSNPPPIAKKELKTKLLIKDGGIALIGGITKSEDTSAEGGIPILKDLPILGNMFKSKNDIKKKNQLYIFLAPKVLADGQ